MIGGRREGMKTGHGLEAAPGSVGGRRLIQNNPLFLHFLQVLVRIFLELIDTARAAEIDPPALVIHINIAVDRLAQDRALGLVTGGPGHRSKQR